MKRLFAVLMVVSMLGVWGTQGALAAESLKGDANGDGDVNVCDLVYAEQAILGLRPYTAGADTNNDGKVSIGDIVRIQRIILGLPIN